MQYSKETVFCKSIDLCWQLESSSLKPNTLRLIDSDEFERLSQCKHIVVENRDDELLGFARDISNILDVTDVYKEINDVLVGLNKRLVLISWNTRTENTCQVIDYSVTSDERVLMCQLSCGHRVPSLDLGQFNPSFSHCPQCNAKVVHDDN